MVNPIATKRGPAGTVKECRICGHTEFAPAGMRHMTRAALAAIRAHVRAHIQSKGAQS
jgi:hypothetical protein